MAAAGRTDGVVRTGALGLGKAEGTAPVQVSNDGTGPGGDRGVGRFGIEFKGRVFMHFLRI